jgi:putative ABC transport system permease protein
MKTDLRFVLRQLRRAPAFSLIAILSLAIGIGSTTAVFSVINSVLLRASPYRQPEQLAFLTLEKIAGGNTTANVSANLLAEWRQQTRSFAGLAAYNWTFTFLVHPDGNESVEGMLGSAGLFEVLGVRPLLGRTFTEEEARDGLPVVILGYEFWQRRFAADPQIVGKTIQLARQPARTVIGVMPPNLRFLPSRAGAQEPNYNLHAHVGFWLPAAPQPTRPGEPWNVIARLKPTVSLTQARAEMTAIAAAKVQAMPALAGLTVAVTPLEETLNGEIRGVVLPLLGAVCLVLFIACANVTSLLAVRGLGRRKELAVRTALGASWGRLLRLALTESLLLAGAGGVLGAALAIAATKLLLVMAPTSIPRLEEVAPDLRMLAFAVAVSILTGLTSGAMAAWQVLRPEVNQALKAGGGKQTQGHAGRRLLGLLVTGELALTLMLLIGAGLMVQTIRGLVRVPAGYETREITTMVVTSLKPDVFAFHEEALQKVAALPGVTAAAFVWGLPLTGNQWRAPLAIAGRPPPRQPEDRIVVSLRSVTPDYFRLMGISLRSGRIFSGRDRSDAPPVALINGEMARRYFPGEEALGQRLSLPGGKPMEIVGVLGDLRTRGLGAPVEPEVYLPFFQAPAFSKHLAVRSRLGSAEIAASVRRELRQLDPGAIVEKVRTMDRIRDDSISAQRFAMTIIAAFSLMGTVLAAVGLYGVMSHTVMQRAQEIGVRLAIGASAQHILRLILGEGLALAAAGIALGLAGAAALTRVLRSLLFGVQPTDPLTFAAVPALLLAVALLACWLPARRATRIDPLRMIRED